MDLASIFRPRRELVFPFFVLIYSLSWYIKESVKRETFPKLTRSSFVDISFWITITAAGCYVASAIIISLLLVGESSEFILYPFFVSPSNVLIFVVCILALMLEVADGISDTKPISHWIIYIVDAVRVFLGWPIISSVILHYTLGNLFPRYKTSIWIQRRIMDIELLIRSVWIFCLGVLFLHHDHTLLLL